MIWSTILAVIGIFGVYLVGKKNAWGWVVGIIAQLLWAIYSVATGQWGFLISCAAYAWIYGKSFLAWSPLLGRETLQVQRAGDNSISIQVAGNVMPDTLRLINENTARFRA